ncbi:snf7 family [Lecanosticta acicola]|uniref:Snf7 family n=1 Tax=Lecanosticta acicola TaxID=111012 RepID=A0AAI8YVW3_9PEZI|nr:snf7 family [Lecanosticta acicola]
MTSQLLEFLRTHEEAFRSRSRLASLYSDFRYQRNTNPDGYVANSSAWLRALSNAAKEGLIPSQSATGSDRLLLSTGEELVRDLQTQEYGRPLALGAVVQDAVKSGRLVNMKEFLEKEGSIYHKGGIASWIPGPGDVVRWGLRQVGLLGEGREDQLVKGQWVIVANVEAAAKMVTEQASKIATSNTTRVFSKDLFNSRFASTVGVDSLTQNDLNVLLRHLQRDRAAIAYSPASGTVKFKADAEAQPSPISEEDVSIASLRTLISDLEPQIDQLTARISQLDIIARTAVSKKQLSAAKTALRQRKLADTKLQQRTSTLAQLEDVYAKIEQAADQVEIVRVMEMSGQTLKNLNKQTGGVERVQDVMEGLREEMMNVDEIRTAINEVSAGEVDEVEVEDELEALEKVEREKIEAQEKEDREKREAEEKEDREKKEAEEAEQTRKRLEELESASTMKDPSHQEGEAQKEGA